MEIKHQMESRMKHFTMKRTIYSSLFLTLLMGSAFADQSAMAPAPGKLYIGIFGGYGSSNNFDVSQYGTAFYTEASGGPLAVNAFGDMDNHSGWLGGAQIGYKAQDILLSPNSLWALGPAIELEGFYLGKRTFTGDLTNDTSRLPEHDFAVSFPMKRSVFLTNFVVNFDNPCYLFHPYVGVGLGGAIVKISGADGMQVSPPEEGINHYNANTSDRTSTFAGQVKAGVSYDINQYFSLFAEYRWLYLANTQFAFGSTVYPSHVATSNWQVKMDAQHYNIGTVGIRLSV